MYGTYVQYLNSKHIHIKSVRRMAVGGCAVLYNAKGSLFEISHKEINRNNYMK